MGLTDRSRRPHRSPSRRVFAAEGEYIVSMRKSRQLGIKRLRNELRRLHGMHLAVDTIHKVLCRHGLNRIKRPKLARKRWKHYSRPVPGDRVQIDVCKIGAGLYQYTAIDDCSRYQVIGVFRRKDRGLDSGLPGSSGRGAALFPSNASRQAAARSSLPTECRTGFASGASSSDRSGHVHPI